MFNPFKKKVIVSYDTTQPARASCFNMTLEQMRAKGMLKKGSPPCQDVPTETR